MVTEKIQRLAKRVEDALGLIYGAAAITELRDGNNDLYFEVKKTGAAAKFAVVRFKTFSATTPDGLDGIGLPQRVYEPHVVQVGFDLGGKASVNVTLTAAVATKTVTINGVVFTAMAGAAVGDQFTVAGDDNADAAALAAAINASVTAGVKDVVAATATLKVVTITAVQPGLTGNGITVASNDASMVVATAKLAGGTIGYADEMDRLYLLGEMVKSGVETQLYAKAGLAVTDLVDANNLGVFRNNEYPLSQV